MNKFINLFKVFMSEEAIEEVAKTLRSGYVSEGNQSKYFEIALQQAINNPNSVLVNSGTSALTLAYHLIDLKPEDYVLSTSYTCLASVAPIITRGAKLVFSDIDPKTGNLDPESIRQTFKNFYKTHWPAKIKAIAATFWGGSPAEIDEILAIAKEYNIPVIFDAAHALGSFYKNSIIGESYPNTFTCFSLQAVKIFSSSDGGLLACPNKETYDRATLLRWFGIDRNRKSLDKWQYDIPEVGYKMHVNDVMASIGLGNMKYFEFLITTTEKNGKFYNNAFKNLENKITPLLKIKESKPNYWLYTLLVPDVKHFQNYMKEKGIETDQVHVDIRRYSALKAFSNVNLPGADEFEKHHICIPCHWALTENELNHITKSVQEYKNA